MSWIYDVHAMWNSHLVSFSTARKSAHPCRSKACGKDFTNVRKTKAKKVTFWQYDTTNIFWLLPMFERGVGHKGKCCAIIDVELADDVLYDNLQGSCHFVSTDMWIGFVLVIWADQSPCPLILLLWVTQFWLWDHSLMSCWLLWWF